MTNGPGRRWSRPTDRAIDLLRLEERLSEHDSQTGRSSACCKVEFVLSPRCDLGLAPELAQLRSDLDQVTAIITTGLREGRFSTATAPLFTLRIQLADLVRTAVGND